MGRWNTGERAMEGNLFLDGRKQGVLMENTRYTRGALLRLANIAPRSSALCSNEKVFDDFQLTASPKTSLTRAKSRSTSTCQFATAKRAAGFPSHAVPLT